MGFENHLDAENEKLPTAKISDILNNDDSVNIVDDNSQEATSQNAQDESKADNLTKNSKVSSPNEKKVKNVKEKANILPQKESLNFKCEYFFGKNWKYVASFIGIAVLVASCELHNLSGRMEKLEQVVLENNEKVVLTTTDGRAIKVTKEPLKAEYLKMFVVSTLVNNFVVSRSQLTNNFSEVAFKDYGAVLDNVPQIRNILRNFMDYKNDPEKNIKVNQIAVGDLRGYVQWLINAVAQDRLPEYIAIKDYSVEKYEYEGDKFEIKVIIKVVTQSYIIAKNEYQQGSGEFGINATGKFYLERSSDVNPYGLRIESLKISPVTK